MATVRQSSVTNKAKDRHYLHNAKNFDESNRYKSYFAREDSHFWCLSTANGIRYFNFGSWPYFWDKRRNIFVPERKGI
jgi:hypothetical protein